MRISTNVCASPLGTKLRKKQTEKRKPAENYKKEKEERDGLQGYHVLWRVVALVPRWFAIRF